MQASPTQPQKLTLTQLQRFLPLPPPKRQFQFPQSIKKYLLSSSFNNFSLKEQAKIKHSLGVAYRNYFPIPAIVEHILAITQNKFTEESVEQALSNTAQKYQLIEWYLFVRVVMGAVKKRQKPSKEEAVSLIIAEYRKYLKKRKIARGRQQVEIIKNSLQQKLIRQFGKEVLTEIKQIVGRNRIQMQQKLSKQQATKITYIHLQKIVNDVLQLSLDHKKVKYLYLRYDWQNYGAFQFSNFSNQLFSQPKQVIIQKQVQYLKTADQILNFIRGYMKQLYYSSQQMMLAYENKYHKKVERTEGEDEDEIHPYELYLFLEDSCENKLSYLQARMIQRYFKFVGQITMLFDKKSLLDIEALVKNLSLKLDRKKQLKKQNEVFYHFRKIILILICKSKKTKLNRSQFTQLITSYDPSLKYDAFFCVWRVYGGIINLERMRKQCKISILACHFNLSNNVQGYQKIVQKLTEDYPAGTEVPYSKVEERINLQCEFVLENYQIKPLPLDQYSEVDYRKCISQILPLDFQLIVRAYIFNKVSSKFIALWRGVRLKKKEQQNKQFLQSIFTLSLDKKQQSKELISKDKKAKRKLTPNKSVASLASKTSGKSKKEYNQQHLDIIRTILHQIFDSLASKPQRSLQDSQRQCEKIQVALACRQHYTLRSILTKADYHPLIGGIACGKDFIQLKQGNQVILDIKIPYKPDIQILDFSIWNNSLAVFTSYNTLEVYALGQANNYPVRTIQFLLPKHQISVNLLDKVCQNRFSGRYPVILKPAGEAMFINLISSQQIYLYQEDPTIQPKKLSLSFQDHYYPSELTKWIIEVKKKPSQALKFIESLTKLLQSKNDKVLSKENLQIFQQTLNQLEIKVENISQFDYKKVIEFCSSFSPPILKTLLLRECGVRQKLSVPTELGVIVKLVLQYMRENNYSLHQMIQQITYQGEEVGLRQFKNYLMRVSYQQFLRYEKQIDKYLRTITRNKTIQYSILADMLGQSWPYSLTQKPYFLLNDYFYLKQHDLLVYTINGSSNIYIRIFSTGQLIAQLIGHANTPIIYLINSGLILISGDSKKLPGETIDISVWNLQRDLIDRFSQRPPWIITSRIIVKQVHDQPLTSLSYLPRSNLLVTTSLDSILKIWRIQQPFNLLQLKRIYSNQHFYISAESIHIILTQEISMQYLLTCKINKQISSNNIYRYESTVQIYAVETIKIKAPSEYKFLDAPLKVQQGMIKRGQILAIKKKVLLSKANYEKIQSLNRATLMLQSLDRNIYNSLKNAYIFENYRQLNLLCSFLKRSEYSQIVYRKVIEDYGLHLVQPGKYGASLQTPPILIQQQNDQITDEQIELSGDSFDELLQKIRKQTSNNGTIIDKDILYQIIRPYIVDDQEQKLRRILEDCGKDKNKKMIEIVKLKQYFKTYRVEGIIAKFYSAMRSLILFLKEKRIHIWQLFSINKSELEKCKKVRSADLTTYLQYIKFQKQKAQAIIDFLNRNGTISLFQFLHFVRMSLQSSRQSELMPNYSSLLLSQSQIQVNRSLADKQKQKSKVDIRDISMTKSGLQQQIQQMLNRKSSRLSQMSDGQSKSRAHSNEKLLHKNSLGEQENRAMINSTSRGSLSKDITYTKDSIKRQALTIIRNLQDLLKNEGKSIWELLALATPDFICSPVISETEYFIIFDYLKTPFLLKEKLNLLKYIKRQANGLIDMNIIFELLQNSSLGKQKVHGEKFIVGYLLQKLQEFSGTLQQAIQVAFYSQSSQQQRQIDQLTLIISKNPFSCSNFALKEFQQLLLQQKKIRFALSDLKTLFMSIIQKHNLKFQFNKLSFLGELKFRIQNKQQTVKQLFPKCTHVDLPYFLEHGGKIHPQPTHLQRDFQNIMGSFSKTNKTSNHVKWQQFIKELEKRLGKLNEEENHQLQASRKLIKQLQNLKITLLQFFLSLDRSRKFYLTQEQFQAGLAEFNISYDLWININKRYAKRLYYYQLVRFLQQNRIINYKTVDSQVQMAMQKFTKRYLRNEDIESAFNRIKGDAQKSHIFYDDFRKSLKCVSYFNEEQIILLFSLLSRQGIIKESRDGNEQLLRDHNNLKLSIGFKKFADVIGMYRAENITKTPNFRFYDFLKKRNISLLFEYRKWLDRNKKMKEVSQALKKNNTTIGKQAFIVFLTEIKGGLNQKQIKELVAKQGQQVDFQIFLNQLETIYKRGTLDLEKEEAQHYLRQVIKKVEGAGVSLDRLFQDYSQKGHLSLSLLGDLCLFIQSGLNKIQLRRLFSYLDKEKKGSITISQLMQAVQIVRQEMDKDDQDYRFDYIVEKLTLNSQKYVLKSSKNIFSIDRARIIFNSILNSEQADLLYSQCLKQLKRQSLTEQDLEQFIRKKSFQLKMRFDKKDRQLIAKILNFLKKLNIQIQDGFSYLGKHSSRQQIKKQQFVLLLQTLQLRCDLASINSLFASLQDGRRGLVNRAKWEQKLQLVQIEQQIQSGIQSEDLRLFYKVKLYLAEVYLIFVRKSYKQNQIFHYFDRHSSGKITPEELIQSLAELGIAPEEDFIKKIINYLDRSRQGCIRVSFLAQQLQQCLSSKMRLVLHTKASRLFQEKAKFFQEKSNHFIQELSQREQLVQIGSTIKSCILEYKFMDLMKQFGCSLTEDQFQDIRRNFHATQGFLFLYPIYLSFSNLFKDKSSSLDSGQVQRLKTLFLGMVKHNYSIQQLQKFSGFQQLYNFIEQLGSLAPVDIKLIINSCLFEGTRTVDIDSLRIKIRNAFLTVENDSISESFIAFAELTHEDIIRQLKRKINLKAFQMALGSNQGQIDFQIFELTLQKMGIGLTKKVAKQYFQHLSGGKDKLNVSQLLQDSLNNQLLQQTVNQSIFKTFIRPKTQQSEETNAYQSVSASKVSLSEHIIKSLNFKQTSFNKQLSKFYELNYGFISYADFLIFLKQIGIDSEQNKQQIKQFLQDYSITYRNSPFDCKQLLNIQQLQAMISESTSQLVKLLHDDKQIDEKIQSKGLNQIISNLQLTEEDVFQSLKQNDNKQYSLNQVFKIICKKYGKRCLEIQQIIRMIPHYVMSYELFINWWQSAQNAILSKELLNEEIQIQVKSNNQKPSIGYYDKFTSRNPIKNYQKAVDRLCSVSFSPSSQNNNLQRLSAIILYEDTIVNKYRLQINPNLVTPNIYSEADQVKIALFDGNFPVKALNSLTIDEERQIDQCGLLIINQKYYGLPINLKRQFQNMAAIAYTLDPQTIFYKTKNFYLWQPISQSMPKGALQYRWRMIPSFAKLILNQISKAHELGFALPHLRWSHLNKSKGIQKVNYPCSIDKKGQIKQQLGWSNLNYQDAYCCPQFLTGQKDLTYKCDSWIFGCLLYEFIYNHPPASFLSEIKRFADESKQQYSLTQLLDMEQLPITFCYQFFVEEKLKKLIALEHQLKPNIQLQGIGRTIKRQQSLRGLMKPLQIIFGDEYKQFESQFELLKQINTAIYECLNPNPHQRPSIEILQQKSIFAEGGNYQIYKNILDKHNNCLVFYDRIIHPVISMLNYQQTKNTTIILNSLKNLQQNISIFINCKQIGDQFIIPKRYAWPSKNKGIYSSSLLESKQKIRRTNNFNIIALLFNSGYFESIIFISLVSFTPSQEVQQIFESLLDLFVNFLFSLKDYKSLFSGYIKNFIDYILRIIYEEPFGVIYKQWIDDIQLPQKQRSNILNNYKKIKKIHYLKPHSFNSRHCLRAIRLLQQITYITGEGNIQFTPIRHFLLQYSDIQDIIQLTHNQIKLVRGPDDTLIINYFRDHLEQEKKAHQQLKMKVEVDLLRFLQNNNEIKTNVLVYYRDIISMYHSHIDLLKKPYMYLIFASILRDNLESVPNKLIVLEIICSIIDQEEYLRYFKEPSSNLIAQILRLMIEPPKTHASHDEYLQLQPILNRIHQSLDINVWGQQSISHSILFSNQMKSEKYDQQL